MNHILQSKRFTTILFFVATITAALILFRRMDHGRPIGVGATAPDFVLKDQGGREVRLHDFHGSLVFLNFWATNCAPCVREMPDMEILSRVFKQRKFHMLAVTWENDWNTVRDFYKSQNLTIPAYLDPARKVYGAYGVYATPETFVIDGNGVVL